MRTGNFTSSEIWKLTTFDRSGKNFGKPALNYIDEKAIEKVLGRSLTQQSNGRETSWGTFVEMIAFNKLPFKYRLTSRVRYSHPTIENWTGMPDTLHDNCVGDIKCPFTIKSYMNLYLINSISDFKERAEEYYWQLVSNSILTKSTHAELIIYCPYKSELEEIRAEVENFDGDQNQIAFINWATDEQLPYLLDDGVIKNMKIFKFEVPEIDKYFLTNRVKPANAKLNEQVNILKQIII